MGYAVVVVDVVVCVVVTTTIVSFGDDAFDDACDHPAVEWLEATEFLVANVPDLDPEDCWNDDADYRNASDDVVFCDRFDVDGLPHVKEAGDIQEVGVLEEEVVACLVGVSTTLETESSRVCGLVDFDFFLADSLIVCVDPCQFSLHEDIHWMETWQETSLWVDGWSMSRDG